MNPLAIEPFTIAMAGDWHANLGYALHAVDYCADNRADVIIHTGDFGYRFEPRFINGLTERLALRRVPLLFVDGNHDYLRRIQARASRLPNGLRQLSDQIFYLPRGLRWSWGQVDFLAMGGAYSVDRAFRQLNTSWWTTEEITPNQVKQAAKDGKTNVLISHDCPSLVPIPGIDDYTGPRRWPQFDLDMAALHRRRMYHLVEQVKPDRIWHGHYHVRYTAHVDMGYGPVVVNGLDCDGGDLDKNIHFVRLHDLMMELSVGPFAKDRMGGVR